MKSRNLHAEILAILEKGHSQAEAAERLGVSTSTVSRTLADHREDGDFRATRDAVERFVESLGPELEPAVLARVAVARALGEKLDWSTRASTGTAAMAASSLAREFRAVLSELHQSSRFDELREALLAADDE